MSTRQLVVGAIIVDSLAQPTRVLAARRSRPAKLAGSWEFPGGKVEEGEAHAEEVLPPVRIGRLRPLRVGVVLEDATIHPELRGNARENPG